MANSPPPFRRTASLGFHVNGRTMLSSKITSVERMQYYIEHLPAEPPLQTAPEHQPPKDWPHAGAVEFKNVVLRSASCCFA